jgi:serine protease inhibitor
MTVDRPFIYLINDDLTGELLFVGRVLDPTAG